MNIRETTVFMAFACCGLAATTAFADGSEHPYLYEKGNSGASTQWSPSVCEDPELTIPASWNSEAYLVTVPSQPYSAGWSWKFTGYGMIFQKGINHIEDRFLIGAGGIQSTVANGWTLPFYGTICIKEDQTWTGLAATTLSSKPFIIQSTHDNYPSVYQGGITAEREDLTLTIAGDMVLVLRDQTTDFTGCDVVIENPAKLTLATHGKNSTCKGRLKARKLTLKGGEGMTFGEATSRGSIPLLSPEQVAATVELVNGAALKATATTVVTGGVTVVAAEETTSSVVGSYALADDDTVFKAEEGSILDLSGATLSGTYSLEGKGKIIVPVGTVVSIDPELVANFHGTLAYSSGVVYVAKASDLPSDLKFETSGTAALIIKDQTGFDKETRLLGTKNLMDDTMGLLVTDTPRTDVSVGSGETLFIAGNGLGASGSLTLTDGAKVLFCDTATVAAPWSSSGTVTLSTLSDSVTGTLGGAATATGTLTVSSPGLVKITGGGRIAAFKMVSGNAEVSGGNITGSGSITFVAGHLTLRSKWTQTAKWTNVNLNQTQTGDALFEIAEGGVLTLYGSNNITIGADQNWKSRLYINGGTLNAPYPEIFTINCTCDNYGKKNGDNNGNGVLEIDNGGVLKNAMVIHIGNNGKTGCGIVFGDCTWTTSTDVDTYRYNYEHFVDDGNETVRVRGRVTLDMSLFKKATVVNQNAAASNAWVFEPGARIRVVGANRTFAMADAYEAAVDLTASTPGNVELRNTVAAGDDVPPTAVTWTVQEADAAHGTVTAVGANGKTGPLVASYVVPEGVTFDGSQTNGWFEGFAAVSVSNLTFEAGSAYRFAPFAADFAPFELAGALTLPETLDYYLAADGKRHDLKSEPVVVPAGGVVGTCAWACKGDKSADRKDAALSVAEGQVLLDYKMPGLLLLLR